MQSTIETKSPVAHYNATAKLLHWVVAAMILLQFILAKLAEWADEADHTVRQLGLLSNHKSVGMTILAIAIIRLLWRLIRPPPPLPASMPRWQVLASHASHWSLYALLFALPVTGWLMSSASAYSVSWFNLFQWPDLVGADPDLKHQLEDIHESLSKFLIIMAGVHILAALKHAVIDKDEVLRRIVSLSSLVIAAAILITGLTTLAFQKTKSATTDALTSVELQTTDEIVPTSVNESALPVWSIDHANSYIRFIATQSGASFTGEWVQWTADIRFAATQLENSTFDVLIDTRQVQTNDAERDTTLADVEWFDSRRFPQATYRARSFKPGTDGRYLADGRLTIKGKTFPVELDFTVTENDGQVVLSGQGHSKLLKGQTLLDRFALGLGTGEWNDTEWIGQHVKVIVHVEGSVP